jgi:CRISPR/Cas system Type II protein with McrA/HNH and RuvC-like nuclease domain
MTIDHVLPLVLGGDNDLRNLVLACYACNNRKGEMAYEEYLDSNYLRERRASILGQILAHYHEAIKFNRDGNWSCLCGKYGTAQDDPKSTGCTLFDYGAFYQP